MTKLLKKIPKKNSKKKNSNSKYMTKLLKKNSKKKFQKKNSKKKFQKKIIINLF